MSTLSIHPSAAVQLSAMASAVARFVRNLFQPAPLAAGHATSTNVWALYRMTRGADAVSPAVAAHLAAHAQAK